MNRIEGGVDVLAVIAAHRDSHKALAGSDAYSAQEAPKLEAAHDAVAQLVRAARNVRAIGALHGDFTAGMDLQLTAALSPFRSDEG